MSGSRPVLLVMDFQHGIVERLGASGAPPVLEAAGRAVGAARGRGIPVLFVRVAFRAGFPEITATNARFNALRQAGGAPVEDQPAAQIHTALAPAPDEPVITKRRVSAFSGSDLDVLLRATAADTLVLAGISTSGVVLSTVRQAADLDYRLVVLADACADPDPQVHSLLTEKVFPPQALVTAVDEWARTG
ncbi:cysteine hydrolase family protein [Parafrankia sp. EUN1f]|uniref:cysteine hydrolase family protein n=1 Tax=Parafrankia sp. EUN1f TaxID=102897 RepID=UPI0001C46D62|nr:isochorismatase family cysteine hydrolase [Parafrankia sp. EUN1f]EFC79856.1 isochorismatase hydrolase [Parafrankia sp. EUN1f]